MPRHWGPSGRLIATQRGVLHIFKKSVASLMGWFFFGLAKKASPSQTFIPAVPFPPNPFGFPFRALPNAMAQNGRAQSIFFPAFPSFGPFDRKNLCLFLSMLMDAERLNGKLNLRVFAGMPRERKSGVDCGQRNGLWIPHPQHGKSFWPCQCQKCVNCVPLPCPCRWPTYNCCFLAWSL